MSNLASHAKQPCAFREGGGAIELILEPRERELGGFTVRRVLPTARRKMVGPWIFFDHMGPADFPAGQGINVRPHPHINLATVTYLFEGEILHRDSLGSLQLIRPGDINLMVAGRGIVHSERESKEFNAVAHRQHGLQLWLALPEADEEIEPAFYHYPAAEIPAIDIDGVRIRVMMGSAYGVASPVKTFAETVYVEANLEAGQAITLPVAQERAVYTVNGGLKVGGATISEGQMAIIASQPDVVVVAVCQSRIAVIGGAPVGKRYIDWNFVSSRKERIEQARADWKENRFPIVPGDAQERIPLPE